MIIESIVETDRGKPIGTIRINEDGTFEGRFHEDTRFVDVFTHMAKVGATNGLVMGFVVRPKVIPATPVKSAGCRCGKNNSCDICRKEI